MIRHLQCLPGTGERVENQIVRVGVQRNQAVGNLFRVRRGMVNDVRRHRRDMPDAVGNIHREQAIDRVFRLLFLVLCSGFVNFCAGFAKNQDVLIHDVGIEIPRIRLLDAYPRALDACRAFMPDDVLMKFPTASNQAACEIERYRIELPIQ